MRGLTQPSLTQTASASEAGTEAPVLRTGRTRRPLAYTMDVNREQRLEDMVYVFRFGDTGFTCADVPGGRFFADVDGKLTGSMEAGPVIWG